MIKPVLAALIDEACDTLDQLTGFVSRLTSAQYTALHGADARHTIGKHVRHILDHYEALLAQEGVAPAPTVDYERRQRDPDVEQRPECALEQLQNLANRLSRLGGQPTATRRVHFAYHVGGQRSLLPSSLERELAFLTSHAIHHMAIIALLADTQDVEVANTFGVHPSTLRHWQRAFPPRQPQEVPS
ncbi:DinB family protein [Modicisalibacter tunisiensis]|uniref:DinB family protein n=1 Tax=Modicisalibacter TaxID=574347 RepID=UPI0013D2E9EA|nr:MULTISPECIES: DinB family protein [Modicisalibacter]MBZ9539635.1 DinB family protein [Modicisalibacter tunisiensis]